jgi:hypothetical protein
MLPKTYNTLEANYKHQKIVRRIWWILQSKTSSESSVSDENLPTELSELAHKKTAKYLKDNPLQKELTALPALLAGTRLGKLRLDIKRHLAEEIMENDELVKKAMG